MDNRTLSKVAQEFGLNESLGNFRGVKKTTLGIKDGMAVEMWDGTVFSDIKRTAPRSNQFEGIIQKIGKTLEGTKFKVGDRKTFIDSWIMRRLKDWKPE